MNTRNAEGDWKESPALVRQRRLICRCARDAETDNKQKRGGYRCNFTRRSDSGVFTSDATDEDEESSDLEQSNTSRLSVETIVQVGKSWERPCLIVARVQ